MRAMVLTEQGKPLQPTDLPTPEPGPGEILVEVAACGVCRTDLHVVDGDLTRPKLPLIPGHEIVGRVVATGPGVDRHAVGERVGIPWLGSTCGHCPYCDSGRENLCDDPGFTGYTLDGGYATHAIADARYAFAIHGDYSDAEAAPLLCAGLIGHRALRMAGPEARTIGIYGFGAAAHIVAQVARYEYRKVLAFARPGDTEAMAFARQMGCEWAGGSDEPAPEPLDAALIFAPVGSLVPTALKAVRKGGTVVCGGIHMSDIPGFPYSDLWEERTIRSVANLTRGDAEEFLALAPKAGVRTEVVPYPLEEANTALDDLRAGRLSGAAVLVP
ncbi:propanol-preferring alcohol dehydrogenase [Rhodobium orientis]|uniref:alcohol dehydrogenase n=1 Tax=Rhodobium orientis TaxID=34017 RepID=A0A327JP52_9HYPH|nr:zinc-dependent alcohol dehydrogenase family protein [Rhodobium orientis]MBB4304857.1 propanol-preferring alcohol dehydrogenase [Rhodobium orientis]MBK5949186.1 alcohol dehydrogenase [Rhodobium orientis]RAI27356.1 alcohol dehydrogenase [Rhodobium orientis]